MDHQDKGIKKRLTAIIWLLSILTFLVIIYVFNYGYSWFGWFH